MDDRPSLHRGQAALRGNNGGGMRGWVPAPVFTGGKLCAGKTVGRENGGGRAVPEPPLQIATNLGLNALWSAYFHSNNMETSWVTPQGCRQRYEGGAWGDGSRRRKTLYGFHRLLDRSKRTTPRNRPSREYSL